MQHSRRRRPNLGVSVAWLRCRRLLTVLSGVASIVAASIASHGCIGWWPGAPSPSEDVPATPPADSTPPIVDETPPVPPDGPGAPPPEETPPTDPPADGGSPTEKGDGTELPDPPPVARILVYWEDALHGYAFEAAAGLGAEVTVAGRHDFNALLRNEPWDAVAVDAPGQPPLTDGVPDWTPLAEAIVCRGLRVVISAGRMQSTFGAGSMLLYALQALDNNDLPSAAAIHALMPEHAVFNHPNPITLPIVSFSDFWPDQGDSLEPIDGGYTVAAFAVPPLMGESTIVVGRQGRTILNGQLLDDLHNAEQAVRLWQNELTFVLNAPPASDDCGPALPLQVWYSPDDGAPLVLPFALGPTWSDFDGDGWVDLFTSHSLRLWRNVQGRRFEQIAGLDEVIDPVRRRYGASAADYNADGLPDIATEPRASGGDNPDDCLHLLKNLGGLAFADVAAQVVSEPVCGADAETNCWGDVDGDGRLDLFMPIYPGWKGSIGNRLLHNLGVQADGEVHFAVMGEEAGVAIPPGVARPEGAQFCDMDFDGDLDLYSNNIVYQNRSAPGAPAFEALSEAASGVGYRAHIDEGAALVDYDMDGDLDVLVAYAAYVTQPPGVMIWENRGDGTFFAEMTRVESPFVGVEFGLSAADWDNDGDLDLMTRDVFRRNLVMETGEPRYTVQMAAMTSSRLSRPLAGWADIDRDGDLDAAITSTPTTSFLYANSTYDERTPPAARRHVRVRVVGDSAALPAGVETEFGAAVRLHLRTPDDRRERVAFVASGHGYLNQSEYTLHFALPPDPSPDDPAVDVRFDVEVTFPSLPDAGVVRIDRHVNPALDDINLADLFDREIVVWRSGKARVGGAIHSAQRSARARLLLLPAPLPLPSNDAPLPPPLPATGPTFVGLEVVNPSLTQSVHVREVIVDGVLAEPAACDEAEAINLAAWDVTDPASPLLLQGGSIAAAVRPRNRRNFIATDWQIPPARTVRIVAGVTSYRVATVATPPDAGRLVATGGVLGAGDACNGSAVAGATVDAGMAYLCVRYAD